MSYILDALNKADQTRKQGNETSSELPLSTYDTRQKQSKLTPVLLSTVIIGMLAYWLTTPWQKHQEPKPQTRATLIEAEPTTLTQQTQPQPIERPRSEQTLIHAKQDNSDASSSHIASESDNLLAITQLPREVLDSLPEIRISAHTYAENSKKRMVIINDKMLRENKYVYQQLLLKSITKTGVILEFEGISFTMTAFDSWPY